MVKSRIGRSNFTLDEETARLVRVLIEKHEREHGFRPSMAQLVAGLVRKEVDK